MSTTCLAPARQCTHTLMLPTSLLSGVLFTLLGEGLHEDIASAPRCAGLLAFANTTGAMLGSLLGGFVLLPKIGIETSLASEFQPAKEMDLSVEATGSLSGFETAVAATRPRGTVVLKSTLADRHDLNLAPVVIDEIRILGSRCGPFEPALAALASGEIDTASLVSEEVDLARGAEALRRAAEPGVLKVLIRSR